MEKRKKVPKTVNQIILKFPAKMDTYECFQYSRRLEIAYQAVRDVLRLSVKGVTEKGGTKVRVTARRFICRIMKQMHPNAGIVLLGSSIFRDHSMVVHYGKYDVGKRYNHYYAKKIPMLEKKFFELLGKQDFDLVDDGKLYTVEEIRRMISRMFGAQITVSVTRAAKRRDNGKKERRDLPMHQVRASKKKSRALALVPKRPH